MTSDSDRQVSLPPIAERQLRWFIRYITFYLQRKFHGLHFAHQFPLEEIQNLPVLVCLNHPSWWDPLLALYLSRRLFPVRRNYGPIADAGLAKYRFFERLGFFGIDNTSRSGAVRFLQLGKAALQTSSVALWVTPQGHFTDVRQRPVTIEPGVGHLAHRCEQFAMLPLALEYSFWNERTPEAFACFGRPTIVRSGRERPAKEWTRLFSAELEHTQDYLAGLVTQRNPDLFEPLLAGRAGVGGIYDTWRALKARLQGRKFEPQHGRI